MAPFDDDPDDDDPIDDEDDDDLDLDEDVDDVDDGEDDEDDMDMAPPSPGGPAPPEPDPLAEKMAEVRQQAREEMLADGIISMSQTIGAEMHEFVHALCSCLASACHQAAGHISHMEIQSGKLVTHQDRVRTIGEEILEKIELLDKQTRERNEANADRTDTTSAPAGGTPRKGKSRAN